MRLVLVPPVPALLPEYAGLTDPVPDLREACVAALAWLVDQHPGRVVLVAGAEDTVAPKLAVSLLASAGFGGPVGPAPVGGAEAVVVLANGSARRGEKAPGHLDERSFDFDHAVGSALKTGDLAALRDIDRALARDLLAVGLPELADCAQELARWSTHEVLLEEDPYGVQYWVVTAQCGS